MNYSVAQRKVDLERRGCCWEGGIYPLIGVMYVVELLDRFGRSDWRLGVAGAVVHGFQNRNGCDSVQTLSKIRSRIPHLSLPLRALGVVEPWVEEPEVACLDRISVHQCREHPLSILIPTTSSDPIDMLALPEAFEGRALPEAFECRALPEGFDEWSLFWLGRAQTLTYCCDDIISNVV